MLQFTKILDYVKQFVTKHSKTISIIFITISLCVIVCNKCHHVVTPTDTSKYEYEINHLKNDLLHQQKIADSLKLISKKNDSVIKNKEKQIAVLYGKYDVIRHDVKELNATAAVLYLKDRLKVLLPDHRTRRPNLVDINNDKVVIMDTLQLREVNLTFVNLDAKTEVLDSTNKLVKLQTDQINVLNSVISNSDATIGTCKTIIANQDIVISNQKATIGNKELQITKLQKTKRVQSTAIIVVSTIALVLGLLK